VSVLVATAIENELPVDAKMKSRRTGPAPAKGWSGDVDET